MADVGQSIQSLCKYNPYGLRCTCRIWNAHHMHSKGWEENCAAQNALSILLQIKSQILLIGVDYCSTTLCLNHFNLF